MFTDTAISVASYSKIIIPILPYGPNNQLRGFRETVYLASKLNRVIVPPPFFKHYRTDSTSAGFDNSMIIDPWHRIDINRLAAKFPVMSTDQISSHCNGTFDVFFKSKKFYCNGKNQKQFEHFFHYLRMSFGIDNPLVKLGKECMLQNAIPEDSLLPDKGPIHLQPNKEYIDSVYTSDGVCAIWIFPYHCIQFKNIMDDKEKTDPSEVDDNLLMERIVQATSRPKYLRDIADDYLEQIETTIEVEQLNYLAIHWRYNIGDWNSHCDRTENLKGKQRLVCKAVLE